jgi:serine/threonine protein kinase
LQRPSSLFAGSDIISVIYIKIIIGKWRGAAVAIKEIEASQEMLKQVAKLLLNMQPHKNITQIYGVCQHEDKMLVVMEYLLGGSLERLMQKRKRKGTPLSDEEIIRLATGIASGMVHLHAQKIFHRDLEARNILIAPENNHLVIKLSHFGLSLPDPSHDSSDVHEETKVGSARWMAPESLQRQVYSAKSDVFSFGVLLWGSLLLYEYPQFPPQKVSYLMLHHLFPCA